MNSRLFLIAAMGLVFSPATALAGWANNGIAVASATNQQIYPVIVSDGAGGAIIAWQDMRDGNYDIYVQRLSATGAQMWTPGGLPLCTATGNQSGPQIVSDGAGGAIVAWYDGRGGAYNDIYARRVDASGAAQWTTNGTVICDAVDDQANPVITSDGLGGAIIAWDDNRNLFDYNTYVQRISGAGVVQYAANGVPACQAPNNQFVTAIVPNGTGAGIVVWYDTRNGVDTDIYAQRVNSIGGVSWAADGIALCSAAGDQESPTAISDGSGGAIITWEDLRGGGTHDIYAQHVISNGSILWATDGIAVCTAANDQVFPTITSDASTGAIISWYDARSGAGNDIYAQHVDGSGVPQWISDGVAVCSAPGAQDHPALIPDGSGGAIIAWNDNRNGNPDIYTQHVSSTGAAQWAPDGIAVVNAPAQQSFPALAPVAGAGAIFTWQDFRNDTKGDIYAVRLQSSGTVPSAVGDTPPISIALGENRPNPFSSETTFDLTLDHESDVSAEVFDVAGRRVRTMAMGRMSTGVSMLEFDGRDQAARDLPSGVYFFRVRANGETITKKMVLTR